MKLSKTFENTFNTLIGLEFVLLSLSSFLKAGVIQAVFSASKIEVFVSSLSMIF